MNDLKKHKRELSMRGMIIAAGNDSDFPTGHKESLHQQDRKEILLYNNLESHFLSCSPILSVRQICLFSSLVRTVAESWK